MRRAVKRPAFEDEILDEEAWAAPDRLSEEECLDQIGRDRAWPSQWKEESE